MNILGIAISGLGWFIPLVAALLAIALTPGRIAFPVVLWMPWAALALVYLLFSDADHAFQRTVMIVCPVVIGMAVSRVRLGDPLKLFLTASRVLAFGLWAVVAVETGLLVTGTLPDASGIAPAAMTAALLCTVFAANIGNGDRTSLLWWAALALIPVVGVTRTGIVATAASLPLTFAPLRSRVRLASIGVLLVAGLALFQTERVQRRMFFSGSGSLEELSRDNPDFAMSGRRTIWDAMQVEIDARPWFGHGANASEPFVSYIARGLTHPHNDWLRLLFDYGYFGTGIFAATIIAQVLHLLVVARRASMGIRTLLYASASSFVTFALFMLTDNVLLYVAFFGNLQFTMIGLAYAGVASERGRNA